MAKSRLMETLPAQVIAERSQILRDLSQRKRRIFHESLVGSVQMVLFEHPKGDGWQNGLTDNYVRVKIKGSSGSIQSNASCPSQNISTAR